MSTIKIKKKDGTYYKIPCSYCNKPITFKHGTAKNVKSCPHCNITSEYILKPKTERILFELQEKLYENYDKELAIKFKEESKKVKHDLSKIDSDLIKKHLETNFPKKILNEMFPILKDYVGSLLKKKIKSKGFYLSEEDLEDKINETVCIWYDEATKKPGFRVDDSWAGVLNYKIIQALYSNKDDEQHLSLDYYISDGNEGKENSILEVLSYDSLEGPTSIYSFDSEYSPNYLGLTIKDIRNEIRILLSKSLNKIRESNDKEHTLYGLLGLIALNFKVSKKYKEEVYLIQKFGSNVKTFLDKFSMILRKKLYFMMIE